MAESRIWRMLAYKAGDESQDEFRDAIPEWRIEEVFRWARFRGYDSIYFDLADETAEFRKVAAPEGVRHSG